MTRRLTIDLGTPLAERADLVLRALTEANDARQPDVVVRGNQLARMTANGVLQDYEVDSLRTLISRRVAYERTTPKGPVHVADPPIADVRDILARDSADYDGLPRVERVVDVPVVGRTGRLVTEPGYDAEGRLFYRPAGGLESLDVPTLNDVETVDQVVEARDYIDRELFRDFGFDDDASRAHAFALLLLPFVRDYIGDGPTPMHGVFAPSAGAAKSYLAAACLIPGCGMLSVRPGGGGDDAEWRKVITSELMRGASAIIFDNLHGTLASPSLAAALTTGTWSDRVLGKNKVVELPVRNAWVATANNPQISTEHVRRIAPIFLDPGDVLPSDRPAEAFRHPDLHEWALENRAELVRAALVLVQNWLAGPSMVVNGYEFVRDGESVPAPGRTTLGSFLRWGQVTGGILEAADIGGFLGNRDRLKAEADDEHRDAAAFFAAWHALGREPMTVRELTAECELPAAPLNAALPAAALPTTKGQALHRSLGYWLRGRRGQRIGGHQLLRIEDSRCWYVKPVARG